MGIKKIVGISLVLLSLTILPMTASAGEKSVTMIFTGQLTGPGATIVVPLFQGIDDYVNELNAKGGVDGVKIDWKVSDSRYDVSRAISVYQRYRKAPKLVAATVVGTPHTAALKNLATRDKVPVVSFTSGGRFVLEPGYVFFLTPPFQNLTGASIDWLWADWKKKGRSGKPTVGMLTWEGSAGKEAVNGSVQYAKQLGIKFLQPEFFPPGSLKFDSWLIRLADLGADYILMVGTDPDAVFIIRDAHGLGLTEKIQFISTVWGLTSTGRKLVTPDILEGAIAESYFLMGDEAVNHPAAELFEKYRKKPRSEMNSLYLTGFAGGKLVEKALRIALKEVGYEKINGEAYHQALQKIQGDITEGAQGYVTLDSKKRIMSNEVRFYRVTNGELTPISDWVQAPDCVSLGNYK